MADEFDNQDLEPRGAQAAARTRTFLKGIVYFDNRRASIDCTIRDLSDTGARVVFASTVMVPDLIELHIPQKQTTLPARVRRRDQNEIGVSFEDQRSLEPRRSADADLVTRVAKLESELASITRLLKKLEARVFPSN